MAHGRPDFTYLADTDIIAQTIGSIAVDIAAQTLSALGINITAQDLAELVIKINAQAVGVYLQPEWAAKEGTDKTLTTSDSNKAWNEAVILIYEVPAGKTLYINQASFYCHAYLEADADNNQMGQLQICRAFPAPTVWYCLMTGNGGGQVTFPKPLVFEAGDTLWAYVCNRANHAVHIGLTLTGYEV